MTAETPARKAQEPICGPAGLTAHNSAAPTTEGPLNATGKEHAMTPTPLAEMTDDELQAFAVADGYDLDEMQAVAAITDAQITATVEMWEAEAEFESALVGMLLAGGTLTDDEILALGYDLDGFAAVQAKAVELAPAHRAACPPVADGLARLAAYADVPGLLSAENAETLRQAVAPLEAITVARYLADAGVPIFLAKPVMVDGEWDRSGGTGGYRLPTKWQQTVADPAVLDDWKPGMAVCAVMGHLVDGLDIDPRSGGDATHQGLQGAGMWPRSYGRQETPSGGFHDLIWALGVGSKDNLRAGFDVKGGRDDGEGRGFLFLAPTIRRSKATGELASYRWTVEPDLTDLIDGLHDDTGLSIADMITRSRNKPAVVAEAPYAGPAYADLSEAHKSQTDRFVAAVVKTQLDDLREMRDWPEGHRDTLDRGWERRTSDKAQSLRTMLAEGWSGLDAEDLRRQFIAACPPAARGTTADPATKWASQTKPATGKGRIDPPVFDEDGVEVAVEVTADPASIDEVHEVFRRWLGESYDLDALDIALSSAAVERLDGDPIWLLMLSGSGNAKTETVAALQGAGAIITSSIASEGALLSATSKKEVSSDATGGLLRKVGPRGLLVIKDFTSILSMSGDARASVIAALREVYDGRWERNVGTDGGRSILWEWRLVVIGAVTSAYDKHHAVIASMGDRFALVRIDSAKGRLASGRQALANTGSEVAMRAELSEVVGRLLLRQDAKGTDIDEDTSEALLIAADLVTTSRTNVEKDYRGTPIEADQPEAPTRFAKMLQQVVRGALSLGLPLEHAERLALRVASDSVPPMRRKVLFDVAANQGSRTADVVKRINQPRSTVDRVLQELHLLGLLSVDAEEEVAFGKASTVWRYSLSDDVDVEGLRLLNDLHVTRFCCTHPAP